MEFTIYFFLFLLKTLGLPFPFFFFSLPGCFMYDMINGWRGNKLYLGSETGPCTNDFGCLCSEVDLCTETDGLKLNVPCQCTETGVIKSCAAEEPYCTKDGSSSIASLSAKVGCQKLPWCAFVNGDVKNQDACRCGDLTGAEECTSTADGGVGLFCHAAFGGCTKIAKTYCANVDASAKNTDGDCVCGINKYVCTEETGMFCNSGQCGKNKDGPW